MEFVSQPVSLEADQRTKRRRRGLIALLLSLSLLTLGTGVFSLAVFTSTDTSSGSFTTGHDRPRRHSGAALHGHRHPAGRQLVAPP